MNRMKTYLLLAALTSLLVVAGQAMGGKGGMMIAMAMAVIMNVGSFWFSDKIVLSMHGAREINRADAPEIFSMVERLVQKAGIPMPKLYVIPEDSPNAFATGRSPAKGAVAMTEGILQALSIDELEGVIAHELAHIAHRDTLIMTVSATIAGALSSLGNMAMWGAMLGGRSHDDEDGPSPVGMIVSAIVAPIAATMIQMAISRSREYMADEAAARYSGKPFALASALRKIESWSKQIPMHSGSPATAHLYISNPFSGGLASLFSTHPPTAERVARLEAMGRRA
ncbi:MAG: protease HtpX [Acidobacteria bacterium]|nr:protease HtpX [Acidobacteriota bacterium]MBM4206402.1 protease HtpX [Gammaproteobacteria bacterium]